MNDKRLTLYSHQQWLSGDFTLISSDGWIFRVPSDLLFKVR